MTQGREIGIADPACRRHSLTASASIDTEDTMATTTRTSTEVVQRGFDALNDRDRAAFVELHADDAVLRASGEVIRGIDAIVDEEFAYFDAFPDLTLTLEDLLGTGETVAARWTVEGTHEGEFMGIEPTGEDFEFGAMGIFRVENERITEVWLEADRLGHLQQLGVVDSPGA